MSLKANITEDMKSAMKAGEKERLATIRLIMAAIKQLEVDGQKDLDDTEVLAALDKMAKQRRESITQFQNAERDDLVAAEQAELDIILTYLPEPLSEEEVTSLIKVAIEKSGAVTMKDMGKVMGQLKPQLQGRADMGKVSGQIKSILG